MYINPHIAALNRIKSPEGRGEFLRLDMNESPDGLPKDFFQATIEKVTPALISMYPETDGLIEQLADILKVAPENISLGNGSDEILKTIFTAFGEPGKKVVAVNPTFAMYSIYGQMVGMNSSLLNYNPGSLEISFDKLLELIDNETGIVSLVNPNNPMGNVYTEAEVILVLEKAKKHNAWVVVDEAYHYFYSGTMVQLVKKYPNLIVTRTFSKLCAMAGLRIGYAVAAEEVAKILNTARPTYCVNAIAVLFASELMKRPELINRLIQDAREGKEFICRTLKENGYDYIAKEGNFIFIKTNKKPNDLERLLRENKVLVKTYNMDIVRDYIRISTGGIGVMDKFWEIFSRIDRG